MEELQLLDQRALLRALAVAKVVDGVKRRVAQVVIRRKGPSFTGNGTLDAPQLQQATCAPVHVGRGDAVQEFRRHYVLQQAAVGRPHGARLEAGVKVGHLAAEQRDGEVGAVKLVRAADENVLRLAKVGDDDKGSRKGHEEDLVDGRAVAVALAHDPFADVVGQLGLDGHDVAEEGARGGGIMRDAGDGPGKKPLAQSVEGEGEEEDDDGEGLVGG